MGKANRLGHLFVKEIDQSNIGIMACIIIYIQLNSVMKCHNLSYFNGSSYSRDRQLHLTDTDSGDHLSMPNFQLLAIVRSNKRYVNNNAKITQFCSWLFGTTSVNIVRLIYCIHTYKWNIPYIYTYIYNVEWIPAGPFPHRELYLLLIENWLVSLAN